MGLFDKEFEKLFESAYTDIRKGRTAYIYSLAEDKAKETLAIRKPDGNLYDTDNNLIESRISDRYEYMIKMDIMVQTGVLTEDEFDRDDVTGITLYIISNGTKIFNESITNRLKKTDIDSVIWESSDDYVDFLYSTKQEAKDTIRENNLEAFGVKVLDVKAQPHILKGVKGLNENIKSMLRYNANDILIGLDQN